MRLIHIYVREGCFYSSYRWIQICSAGVRWESVRLFVAEHEGVESHVQQRMTWLVAGCSIARKHRGLLYGDARPAAVAGFLSLNCAPMQKRPRASFNKRADLVGGNTMLASFCPWD